MSSMTAFAAPLGRSAALDEAHIGHINGTLGTIGHGDIAPWTAWVAKMTNAVRRPGNCGVMLSSSPRRRLANHHPQPSSRRRAVPRNPQSARCHTRRKLCYSRRPQAF
jgi:hypothetical protein